MVAPPTGGVLLSSCTVAPSLGTRSSRSAEGNEAVSDREKPSFSELDRKRREKKSGGSRRRGGSRNSRRAANTYKKKIDERLFGKKGDAGRSRMLERLRASQGTEGFSRVYREYVRGHGMSADIPSLMVLLDVGEAQEALKVIGALENAAESAPNEQKNLLKSRLRNLEMSTPSDALADAAAELIARL